MCRMVTVVVLSVCLSVCLSVKSHLTSRASVHPENTVIYSAGNRGQKIGGVFSETTPLRRSSTPPLKAVRSFGHFLEESAGHEYPCRGFCILVHSLVTYIMENPINN